MEQEQEQEHEIANIGKLTITVDHYFGHHTRTWQTDIKLIGYDNVIAFKGEIVQDLIAALQKAVIVAEGYIDYSR